MNLGVTTRKGLVWVGVALGAVGLFAAAGLAASYRLNQAVAVAKGDLDESSDGKIFKPWVGVQAPDFTITTLDGKVMRLSELKGKRVLIDFWASWCAPCIREIPHLVHLRNQVSGDELVILGIGLEDTRTLKGFADKIGINYPVAKFDEMPSPYKEIAHLPTAIFIDRNGVIQTITTFYHDFDVLKMLALEKDYIGQPKSAPVPLEKSEI